MSPLFMKYLIWPVVKFLVAFIIVTKNSEYRIANSELRIGACFFILNSEFGIRNSSEVLP